MTQHGWAGTGTSAGAHPWLHYARNLRPIIRLWFITHTANKFQHATAARALTRDRETPLSFDDSFLENPYDYPHKLYIARN